MAHLIRAGVNKMKLGSTNKRLETRPSKLSASGKSNGGGSGHTNGNRRT